jgi:hypothetical protein
MVRPDVAQISDNKYKRQRLRSETFNSMLKGYDVHAAKRQRPVVARAGLRLGLMLANIRVPRHRMLLL